MFRKHHTLKALDATDLGVEHWTLDTDTGYGYWVLDTFECLYTR
jgi:hypothetical protein